MIGDGYFQLRAQIGTSLYSLTKLARDLAAPEPALARLHTLQEGLREPFLFVTIGERGAGKSSLLHAIFGREFARDPAFAGRAVTHRYGATAHDEPQPDGSLEVRRPFIFLRDFTLVELPDFSASEHLRRLLPAADLVLVTLPTRGDAAAAWDAFAGLDHALLRHCVFVVQGSDTVSNLELPLIVKRLRHLMLNRLGHACPIFPVSALTRAGFEKLEHYLDGEIVASRPRCEKLQHICQAGREMLAEIGAQTQLALKAAERQERRVEEERLGLAARRDQSLRHAGGALWSLTRLFDVAHRHGAKRLARKLTVGRIWSDPPGWWEEFHAEVETRLRESITRNLASAFETFEADLLSAWQQHREKLRALRLEGVPAFAHDGAALFARLAADLDACDRDGATTLAMQRGCASARSMVQLPAFAAGGGAFALLGALAAGQFVAGVAALTALSGTVLLVVFSLVRGNVLAELRRIMAGRRELVLARLEEEVRGEIDRFYGALDACFQPLEEANARQRAVLDPTRKRLRQLEELFSRCAADIAARKASLPVEIDAEPAG